MEELKSPPPCPATVTVRRNPHRRSRPPPTPSSALPRSLFLSSPWVCDDDRIDINSVELPSSTIPNLLQSENLKVFLRIRPLTIAIKGSKVKQHAREVKKAWPRKLETRNVPKKVTRNSVICVAVKDSNSVIVSPPASIQESKRINSEVYEGFSHVFSSDSSQDEVYEKMVLTLVEDFLKGKSGMLAALGPSGSGKTHTVFGCAREPGMLPRVLHQIFAQRESHGNYLTRTFSLSMLEICSEKGKSEHLFDLLSEGSEVFIQQSTIKGLKEVVISDAQQAESLIARGMLRRATAATNSNSQSSRSQCIINICCVPELIDEKVDDEPKKALLTIVDLAGAEREKKTGNQGLRMVESNFINNTSMVFGLCLRSLLEYQKNPKRPLQKHFQNSLLTRYLREYLEGKKRMALILTVKPGEDDYLETSYLLKQASPFTQIKFSNTEELGIGKHMKRPIQNFRTAAHQKRMKLGAVETFSTSATSTPGDHRKGKTEGACPGDISGLEKEDKDANLKEITVEGDESLSCKFKSRSYTKEAPTQFGKKDQQHQIMTNFAKALWTVLKEYKQRLEIAENEVCCLRDDLFYERKRSSDLENQVKDLKTKCALGDIAATEVSISPMAVSSTESEASQEQHQQEYATSSEPDNVAEVTDESKDIHAVDIYLDNGATVSIASYVGAKNRSEEAAESSGTVVYLQEQDSKGGDSVTNTRKSTGMERYGVDNTCVKTGTDDTDSICCCLESSAVESTDCSSAVKIDQMPQPVLQSVDCPSTVKIDQMQQKQCQELDPTVAIVLEDDASLTREKHCSSATEIAHSLPTCSSQNRQKPKRRLQPVSSNLLKDFGSLGAMDETEKPKGVKGAKGLDTENRSKGSLSLLRLLRNDVYR